MVQGGHQIHIPEHVKGIFVTMSCQMSSKDIDPVYLALVYATNKHMPELQQELICSIVWQSAGTPAGPPKVKSGQVFAARGQAKSQMDRY